MGLTGVPKDTVYPHRLYRLATAVFLPKSRLTENPVTRTEFLGTQTVFSVSQGIMTVLIGGVVRFLPRTRRGVGFFSRRYNCEMRYCTLYMRFSFRLVAQSIRKT